ncbi:unnamed protein product [Camellia sinensis]
MMMLTLKGRVSKHLLYQSPSTIHSTLPLLMRLCSFSSIDIDGAGGGAGRRQPLKGEQGTISSGAAAFARSSTEPAEIDNNNYDRTREDKRRTYDTGRQNPPDPIPNRPLRGSRGYENKSTFSADTINQRSKPVGMGGSRTGRQSPSTSSSSNLFLFDKFGHDGDDEEEKNTKKQSSQKQYSRPQPSKQEQEQEQEQGHDFLEKFKLGFDKGDKHLPLRKQEEDKVMKASPPPPQDVDEIFKKMKETGLIPNAVAMLDGLCKDGLVQEAMKLFGLMREKGTIPEVVIYTAVVEGFCKAQKMDDAMRIFRKMHNNGISPNAFSYTILIQGLYKAKRLEDALDFSVEMLEAGHSLNLATFTGLVDGFCREKGLEDARSIIGALTQKGFSFDEKAVREYLDKKGPFLPLVWEAIFGKKSSQRPL